MIFFRFYSGFNTASNFFLTNAQFSNTVKFGYSEKVTKFEKNLPLKIWRYWVASNFKWKIFSNFVAFSEYPNFKDRYILGRVAIMGDKTR